MKDRMNSILKSFSDSGIIGKIIIAFTFIIIMIFLVLTYQSNTQNEKMLNQLTLQNKNVEDLIENQTQIEVFKKCIKKAHEKAMNGFNNDFLILLGSTLQKNNVPFPQELNKCIQEFRTAMETLKDCLIFPEELEY